MDAGSLRARPRLSGGWWPPRVPRSAHWLWHDDRRAAAGAGARRWHQRQHRLGHVVSRRRSVPPAPERAVERRRPRATRCTCSPARTTTARVDLPGTLDPLKGFEANADAWLGLFKSFDGGQTWRSTLVPGFPQDTSAHGQSVADQRARRPRRIRSSAPGTNGLFYYAGVAFDRGEHKPSAIFVARFIDLNNRENGDPIAYLGTQLVAFSAEHSRARQDGAGRRHSAHALPPARSRRAQGDGTTVTQTVPAGQRLRRLRGVHG